QNVERSTEALPHARTAFAGYVRHFGPDYPIALNARQTLSTVLAALGQYDEAVEHSQALVAGRTDVLGPTHPWTLSAKELLSRHRRAGNQT
ncbi:tetratricopeptide repeat protein, partial [Streptomyces noursei]